MGYPKHYNQLYQSAKDVNPLFDLNEQQIEKPVEDISFLERISLDARYGVSSDAMLPCESQDDSEIADMRVRSDYDIRVSLMDQIEMRTNRDARSKSTLFNPQDYSDFYEVDSPPTSNTIKTPDAND